MYALHAGITVQYAMIAVERGPWMQSKSIPWPLLSMVPNQKNKNKQVMDFEYVSRIERWPCMYEVLGVYSHHHKNKFKKYSLEISVAKHGEDIPF